MGLGLMLAIYEFIQIGYDEFRLFLRPSDVFVSVITRFNSNQIEHFRSNFETENANDAFSNAGLNSGLLWCSSAVSVSLCASNSDLPLGSLCFVQNFETTHTNTHTHGRFASRSLAPRRGAELTAGHGVALLPPRPPQHPAAHPRPPQAGTDSESSLPLPSNPSVSEP